MQHISVLYGSASLVAEFICVSFEVVAFFFLYPFGSTVSPERTQGIRVVDDMQKEAQKKEKKKTPTIRIEQKNNNTQANMVQI